MKKRSNFFKKFALGLSLSLMAIVLCFTTYYFAVTFSTNLDIGKIKNASASSITFADSNGEKLALSELMGKNSYATYDNLPQYTIDAFVSVEDKRFFEHNGVDYIRILGAIKNNILNPDKKQGGSTITQQVIKNTQLTSEKTIKRKLKELKLAKKLEKQFSKKQILEMYLNSIYFGNGCYGIQSASNYYFDKPANELSIAQSALLASTINAPSVYDPVSNSQKANSRKDLILKLMLDNKKISLDEYNNSKKEEIVIEKAKKNYNNQYYKGVIWETCKILGVTESQLKHMNVEIKTYYDSQVQQTLENLISSGKYTSYSTDAKLGSIVLDNKTKSVIAFAGNSGLNLLNTYRQPGSVIKPIMVYAPAFESGKFAPASTILDEPLNISGYTPENANKTYMGNVDIKLSMAKSLNIPAVKILDRIGIGYAKTFARNLGISFEPADNNLALALGGFTKGTTIKQLVDAYMCFANYGSFCQSSFVSSISQNDKVLYARQIECKDSIKDSVAFLINDCLKQTVKSGTAKRMNAFNFDLCAKTGTVGTSSGNTDAYNICYTTSHTIGCWIGSNDTNNPLDGSINGATYPTLFNNAILSKLYDAYVPNNFEVPNSISKIALNSEALSEGILEQDDSSDIFEYFDNRYLPPKTSRSKLDTNISINNFENSKPVIIFEAKRDVIYEIYRIDDSQTQILDTIEYFNDTYSFTDASAETGQLYEYYVVAKNSVSSKQSNSIKLLAN